MLFSDVSVVSRFCFKITFSVSLLSFSSIAMFAPNHTQAAPVLSSSTAFDAWSWLSHTHSLHAHFEQQVLGKRGKVISPRSEGELWLQRPGQFRWNYTTPSIQTIVSNGKHVTWFDAQLKQATIKPAEGALSNALAQLLTAETQTLRQRYASSQEKNSDGSIKLTVTPHNADQEGFQSIILTWVSSTQPQLSRIEILDALNQRTVFTLTNVETPTNKLSSALFNFTPPKDTTINKEGK